MKSPHVFIIIVNWNGYKDTLDCLKSLREITYKNYTIIIIDNGSTDNSINILRSTYPDIKILENSKNLGYTGGVNTGIKYAMSQNADYVLLLNNDTVVKHNFLEELIYTGEKDSKIGILSAIIYYSNNKHLIWSAGSIKSYNNIFFPFKDKLFQKLDERNSDRILKREIVTGCCMLIKKEVIKDIGLHNTKYFLYAEDADYCLRTIKAGYRIVVVTTSKIWHKVSGSSGGEGNWKKDYYNTRNLILLAKENLLANEKLQFYIFYIIGRIYEVIVYIKQRKYNKANAIKNGVVDGLRNRFGENKLISY